MSEQARFASNAIDPTPSSSSAKRTPAQREKKRAQDRQSQRNVRNRTKQHIAYLEARVSELSSYKGLSHLISANETLQAQNAELISALRSIASLVEKVCESAAANAGVTTKKPVESRREPSSETTSSEYPEEALGQYGSPAESNGRRTSGVAAFANHKSDPRGVRTVSATSPRIPARSRNHSTAHVEAGIGLGSSTRVYPMHHAPLLETQAANGVFSPKDDWLPQSIVPSLGAEHDMLWEPSGLSNAQPLLPGNLFNHIASLPFDSSMTSNDHPQSTHLPQPSFIPESQICPPTNQWDTKLTAFILLHRSSVTAFGNKQTLEPSPANFDIFVYPERTSATSDPISHFLASAIIPWNFSLPERLAMAWLNHIFIKWAIAPTPANTQHLPEWFQPKPPQCETSHPIYVDTIPWPEMRSNITFNYPMLEFTTWVVHFCNNLNVSWNRAATETYVTNLDGSVGLSPAFERHLRILENWTLDAPFAIAYPSLALK